MGTVLNLPTSAENFDLENVSVSSEQLEFKAASFEVVYVPQNIVWIARFMRLQRPFRY